MRVLLDDLGSKFNLPAGRQVQNNLQSSRMSEPKILLRANDSGCAGLRVSYAVLGALANPLFKTETSERLSIISEVEAPGLGIPIVKNQEKAK